MVSFKRLAEYITEVEIVDHYLLKICTKYLEKVTRNKGVKDEKS